MPESFDPIQEALALVGKRPTALSRTARTLELAGTLPSGAEFPADQNPYLLYIGAVLRTTDSRATMMSALASVTGNIAPEHYPWHRVRPQDVQNLIRRLEDTEHPATARKILSAVRGVLRQAVVLDLLSSDIWVKIQALPGIKGEREPDAGRALPDRHLAALFTACDDTLRGRRDGALLALLYGAGLRRSEAAKALVSKIGPAALEISVIGKGNRERTIPLPEVPAALLRTWLHVRRVPSDWLFPRMTRAGLHLGQRITPHGIGYALAGLAARAGFDIAREEERLAPHDLRRTYITNLLEAGIDISLVRTLAGHRMLETTKRYDKRSDNERREAVKSLYIPPAPPWLRSPGRS
jgi:site-specific recombinase XerD